MNKSLKPTPRPKGWNAKAVASEILTERWRAVSALPCFIMPVEPNQREVALVEAGADVMLELLKSQGVKVIVSTAWINKMVELKEDESLGLRADDALIKKICDQNNMAPIELDKLEGFLVLLPAHTLMDAVKAQDQHDHTNNK